MATNLNEDDGYVRCPCTKCKHDKYLPPELVISHVFVSGSQELPSPDLGDVNSGFNTPFQSDQEEEESEHLSQNNFDLRVENDQRHDQEIELVPCDNTVLTENECAQNGSKSYDSKNNSKLYPGSSRSNFDASLSILELQVKHGWSEASVQDLLEVLSRKILPEGSDLPNTNYQIKKQVKQYVQDYKVVHACPNDCILFRNEYKNLLKCPECESLRYNAKKHPRKVPNKVLRYFPLIPRLLQLFKTMSSARMMSKWRDYLSTDSKIRCPRDSVAFKFASSLLEEGGYDDRHIRFGLAVDGVSPFKKLSSKWTLFPLMLTIYNLPPDLITTIPNLWLSMIIPGRKQVTNINTYLKPLVEELQELWNGVPAYDISQAEGEREFTLRGILMFCIHDFIGYGFVAGCVVQGEHACPICGPRLDSRYSKNLKTNFFPGNRRFLPESHAFRMRAHSTESRPAPQPTDVSEWLTWADQSETWIQAERQAEKSRKPATKKRKRGKGKSSAPATVSTAKGKKKRKVKLKSIRSTVSIRGPAKTHGIKFRSILFDLPYWKLLPIRHTIDVMHTEKNVAELILDFLSGKKDTGAIRDDMKEVGVQETLWLEKADDNITVISKPDAPYVLDDSSWKQLCKIVRDLKFPSEFSSSLKEVFDEDSRDLNVQKSHNFHILLQYVLPVALRGLLPKGPRTAIILMGKLFRKICSPIMASREIRSFLDDAAIVIALFERYFPPYASTIMVHLVYHVVEQIGTCGVILSRWMYPFEAAYKDLKNVVKNLAKPEANMANCYVWREAIALAREENQSPEPAVFRRFKGLDSLKRTKYSEGVTLLGVGRKKTLTNLRSRQAYNHVINNMIELEPWRDIFRGKSSLSSLNEKFEDWFRTAVEIVVKNNEYSTILTDHVISIAGASSHECTSYKAILCNGLQFNVKAKDDALETCNSLVSTKFEQDGKTKEYVGVVQDIIVLDCISFTTELVECTWFECDTEGSAPTTITDEDGFESGTEGSDPTMIIDEDGFTLVNTKHIMSEEDPPYVQPQMLKQVVLSSDLKKPGWAVVIELGSKVSPERLSDMWEQEVMLQVPDDLLTEVL